MPTASLGAALRTLLALGLPPFASAWISTSQARFGLTIEHIYNESLGQSAGHPQHSLGYLWSQPGSTAEVWGLGGSITWQWDKRLCSRSGLKVEENFWAIPLVSCDSIRASMHRAFATWSANSRHIKFTDVTEQCVELGYAESRCPLAEIWVTSFDALDQPPDESHAAPTVSVQQPRFNAHFRYTNEEYNYRLLGSGPNAVRTKRQVAETVGATLGFRTANTCWYLDSDFCQSFHRWKIIWEGPQAAYVVGVTLFFSFWLCVTLMMCCCSCFGAWVAVRKHAKARIDAYYYDGTPLEAAPCVEWFAAVLADMSIFGMACRLMLLIVIWPMYTAVSARLESAINAKRQNNWCRRLDAVRCRLTISRSRLMRSCLVCASQIFVTCWGCYDFEAGAAHEIGHILGLGHPELAPYEVVTGYSASGQNSYHETLASGVAFDETTCRTPWAGVRWGVPSGATTDPLYTLAEVRPSIMVDFTLHNPRICLEADDLEAINVLYPDCNGGPTEPLCTKPPLNLGWLRVSLTLAAFLVVLAAAALLHVAARYRLRKGAGWRKALKLKLSSLNPLPRRAQPAPVPVLASQQRQQPPALPAPKKRLEI